MYAASAILQEQCPFYELTAITFAWVIKNDKDRLADSDVGYACKVLGHKDGEVSLTFAEMESLIRQRRLSRHSLLVHLQVFIESEIFYSMHCQGIKKIKTWLSIHTTFYRCALILENSILSRCPPAFKSGPMRLAAFREFL